MKIAVYDDWMRLEVPTKDSPHLTLSGRLRGIKRLVERDVTRSTKAIPKALQGAEVAAEQQILCGNDSKKGKGEEPSAFMGSPSGRSLQMEISRLIHDLHDNVTASLSIAQDVRMPVEPEIQTSALSIFDIRQSWERLTQRPAGQEPIIDGVRAIAILWVMALHMVAYQLGLFPGKIGAFNRNPLLVWIQNGSSGVDLFFVISGFLMGSMLFGEMKKTGGLFLTRFYVRRFLRLMPVYAAAMVLALFLTHGLPGHPRWDNAQYAWANLLYVNNLLPATKQYMGWCWSLAIEEQFYLLVPACILLFLGPGKGRIRILIGLMFLSMAIRYGVVHFSGIVPPFRFIYPEAAYFRFFDVVYDKPWMRFGGLLAGVTGAYLSSHYESQMKRFFARTGVITALSLVSVSVIFDVAFTSIGSAFFDRISLLARELWWACFRDVFSLAAMFLILAAIHSPKLFGGYLRRFLSWKGFYPMAQLSYSIYLVHEMLFERLFPKIAPWFVSRLGQYGTMAIDSAIGFSIALCIAVFLYLFVERPCMQMRSHPWVRRLIDHAKGTKPGFAPVEAS